MAEFQVTAQDVLDYLGYEDAPDEIVLRNINRQLPAADRFLQSAIHEDYDREDPRAKELGVMIAAELYDNRGVMSASSEARYRRIARDFMMQMRLEKREQT